MRHIAVVGAGAVGCYLAARLHERGHRITLVARGDQRAAIARDGLLLREPRGEGRRYRLETAEALRERPDLVLLAVKTQDLADACAALLPIAAGVPVVALQNGIRADHIAASALGRDAVLGAVVMCAVTHVQPGEIAVQFPGWLILGEPFGRVGARTRAVARLLDGAAPTYLTGHLRRVRWSKLIANLNNALCAATGLTAPEVGSAPLGRLLSLRLMQEGATVARAAGVRLDHGLYGLSPRALRRDPNAALIALLQASFTTVLVWLPDRAALGVLRAASRSRLNQLPVRFSLWQSIARGRPTEIEYLNGEIARLGARLGVPTPYNAHLVSLVHQVERTRTFAGLEDLVPPGIEPRSGGPRPPTHSRGCPAGRVTPTAVRCGRPLRQTTLPDAALDIRGQWTTSENEHGTQPTAVGVVPAPGSAERSPSAQSTGVDPQSHTRLQSEAGIDEGADATAR